MPPHSHRLPATAPPLPGGTAPSLQPARTSAVDTPLPDAISAAEQACQLLARPDDAAERQARAAEVLARHHWKPMVRTGQRRAGLSLHDAEDAVQNTFMRFLRLAPQHCEVPEAFLFTMFTNCCNDIHRRHRRQAGWLWLDHPASDDADALSIELPAPLATTDPALLLQWRRTLAAVVDTILAQTPARLQVMQAIAQGITEDAEIAVHLGISEAAVGDRKYRVRLILRTVFKDLFS